MVALTPASILTYLVPGSPGSTLASAGDLNYASFIIELSPLFVNKNLPETRAAIYRCTSTAETGSAIITIPISYEPAYIENTASGIGDGQSGLYYTFYHAGDPDDDTQTPIDIYSAAQSRSIATLSPGQILIFAWDFMLTISQSPTETLPASHGYLIYDPLSQSLPLGGTTGQVLTRTADGYEWQTIEAAPDELPAGGAAGNVLTRTSDGSEWASLPDEELPSGGTPSQLLTRTADGSEWANAPTELPSGGDRFQILERSQTGVIWADKYPSGLRGQVLTAGTTGVASFRNLPASELPEGGSIGEVLTRTADSSVWSPVQRELPLMSEGQPGYFLRRQADGDSEWVALPSEGALLGNPKLQTRTYQDGADTFPTTAGDYTITTDGDDSILRIAFDPSEENLAFNLRDDVVEINLYRQGEANIRFLVDQNNKNAPVRRTDNSDDTSAVILRILEVRTATSNLPTWLSQTGTTTFYIYGEADPDALSSEELATQARISALSELNFVLKFNGREDRLVAANNGNPQANLFNTATNRNLAFLPTDAAYERILEASLEGRLDTITLRADALGSDAEPDPQDLSSIARSATFDIDVLEFPDDRALSGNRINIRIRGLFDAVWSRRADTKFFVLNFTTLTPALSSSFASYRYFKASRDPASATDRVVNVGLGSVAQGGGGVRFSANADEILALKALNFELGDDVEIIGFTSEDVHIDGAYLRWDNFTLTYDEVLGTAILISPSALPSAFAHIDVDKVSIHLFPGSAAAHDAAVESIIKRESAFEFAWVVKKNGVDPIRDRNEIRWGFNSLKFSKEGNRSTILKGSHLEPGDNITLTAHTFDGTWTGSYSLNVSDWNFFDNESSDQYFEIGKTGNDRPFNDIQIRAADILKVIFHPGSKKLREQALLVNESGLFYQGQRISQVPTATITGIYPDAANRTITHNVNDYERERIIEEDLVEGDLIELTAFNNGFDRTKREFKHLASAPTFAGGNVSLTFLDSDPELSIEFGRSANLQVLLSKVALEGDDAFDTFRTTETLRTAVANGDADTAGTYGFFNPANFGADDINRVMQLIEPISELGVYQRELANINRVEFRTPGATPRIYEFASPPFITNSSSGESGAVSFIQFFFTEAVDAAFRNATGTLRLTYLGEEDVAARASVAALTTRVDTNEATAQTNATAHAANSLAIAANTEARNSGWILQHQWGGTGGEAYTGTHDTPGVEIGYDAEAVSENLFEVVIGTAIYRSRGARWIPASDTAIHRLYPDRDIRSLQMRANVGTSPLTKNRVSFDRSASATNIFRLYSRN